MYIAFIFFKKILIISKKPIDFHIYYALSKLCQLFKNVLPEHFWFLFFLSYLTCKLSLI